MKFHVTRASDFSFVKDEVVEINTLEELQKFDKDRGEHGLIINFADNTYEDRPSITIYDDYVE